MKIIITQLGRIGDMILATPMFRAVKEEFPDSELHVIAGRHNKSIIMDNPRINKIHVYEKTPARLSDFIINLRKNFFDIYIDPKDHESKESKILSKITKSKLKIGYSNKSNVFDIIIPSDKENQSLHYIEKCFNPLIHLGIEKPLAIPKPELFETQESEKYVNEFFTKLPQKPTILINIAASSQKKMWSVENWIEVLNNIESNEFNLILISVPGEAKSIDIIKEKVTKINIFKSRTINDAISIIKRANLLVTPDTSLVHISSAFNIPLIGLYSGMDMFYNKFRPLCDNYATIRAKPEDWGITSIEPSEVKKQITKFLNKGTEIE